MPGFISTIRAWGHRAPAFTLAELLIGVTISAFVMTAVAVFMGSGIENAFRIKKSLERGDSGAFFDDALADLQNFGGTLLHSGALTAPYGTGILLKNFDAATPLTLLSIHSSTGICDAFSGTVDDPGEKDFLVIAKYFLPAAAQDDAPLTLDHTGHVVRSGGVVVLGTGDAGDSGGNGTPVTSTELRFPGAVSAHGAGFFAADTGNDRVLFISGGTASTLLGPKNGIRFPRSLNVVGGALLIAEGGRILRVEDSSEVGTAFSATVTATGAFSFDSAEVSGVPGSAGIFPSSTGSYAFAGVAPTSVSTAGNTGTLSFPSTPVAMGSLLTFSIVSLTEPPLPGGYGMRIVLKNAGAPTFDQTFRYFTKGDGDLATMTGNVVSVVSTGLSFPYGITSVGAYQNGISNFSAFVAAAPAAEVLESDRIVEDFKVSTAGGVLTLSYVEYVRYDCVGGRHTKRERVLKIPLR